VSTIFPDPREWLTSHRLELLAKDLGGSVVFLRQAGLLGAALGYWVRWQASLDANWPADLEKSKIDELVEEWQKHTPVDIDISELRDKLRVGPAVSIWSREQWGQTLPSLYLEYKSQLDRVSFRMLRLTDKNLALELYHRIKASEIKFDEAARQYGEGKEEQYSGGLFPLQSLSKVPYGLAPLLERITPGQLSMPLRLGRSFCIIQLLIYQHSQMDEGTEEILLAEQLRRWIDAVVELLHSELRYMNKPSVD